MKRYEAEVEITLLMTVPVWADNLDDAAVKGAKLNFGEIMDGDRGDFETNLVGVSRQKGRKMYQ